MSKIPQGEWSAIAARYAQGESISSIARTYRCTPPAIHYILKRNQRLLAQKDELRVEPVIARLNEPQREPQGRSQSLNGGSKGSSNQDNGSARGRESAPPAIKPAPGELRPTLEPPPRPGASRIAGRASAFNDGLDDELYSRAEAAIETFRSCFDAALAEGTPQDRARLRQAASDMMRVAARTTMVLDRLSALGERAAGPFNPRSDSNRPA